MQRDAKQTPWRRTDVHEVSLVAELIVECERRSAGKPIRLVRVRHASSIPEPTLQQAFRMLTEGGSLAGATLQAQAFDVALECGCGFAGAVGHDDLIGASVVVCPACGDISKRRGTADLELLEVQTAP